MYEQAKAELDRERAVYDARQQEQCDNQKEFDECFVDTDEGSVDLDSKMPAVKLPGSPFAEQGQLNSMLSLGLNGIAEVRLLEQFSHWSFLQSLILCSFRTMARRAR